MVAPSSENQQLEREMVVIKGKEKKLNKRIPTAHIKMSAASRKKLKRPQDTQPIATVAV